MEPGKKYKANLIYREKEEHLDNLRILLTSLFKGRELDLFDRQAIVRDYDKHGFVHRITGLHYYIEDDL